MISFRIPTSEDYLNVKSIWEDPDTMEAVGGVYPISEEEYPKWLYNMTIRKKEENCYFLIISQNSCVGEISFHRFNKNTRTAELNIKVKHHYRNKGIGRKALDFILETFFISWDGIEMVDHLRKENNLGINALKSYGFKEKDSEANDTILFFTRRMYDAVAGSAPNSK